MRVPVTVFPDPASLGQAVAARIADGIGAAARDGRRYVLGCPAGRSPATTYAALAGLVGERRLDLRRTVIAMMDEYVLPAEGGGPATVIPADLPHSCRGYARDVIAGPLSAAAGPGRRIADEHLWAPDPADPAAYDEQLAAAGGVDLFLLAVGASDGHVGFNPPGAPRGCASRIVRLAETTRRDNLATFPGLRCLEAVPRFGVTVGIDTIASRSKSAAMIAHGADKRRAVARLSAARRYDPAWPATVITECHGAELFTDRAARAPGEGL